MKKFSDIIKKLPSSVPFVGPETQERKRGKKFIARIGANENVFGPSPTIFDEISKCSKDIWMYSDPENFDLKHAIAQHHKVSAENIVVGEGIDGLLGYLVRLFVHSGVNVVTTKGAYPTFNYHVKGFGGNLRFVPYKDDFEDLELLIKEAIKSSAAIIYVSNPDNPMGTFHPKASIQDMINNLPESCLLCLDEAYCEFAPSDELPEIDAENPRVIRMRTFSKAYGLAGARIGYAIGPSHLIKAFDKIRNHFGTNIIGQRAALCALRDLEYLNKVVSKVNSAKAEIAKIASGCGLAYIPSAANFLAIDCGRDGRFASKVLDQLLVRDIFVRMPMYEPQNRCIRISAGTKDDLAILGKILPEVLSST